MEIISHRGYWIDPQEKNTEAAFIRSFSKNIGTETDIRDYKGELVIAHDIADENSILARTFFEIYNQFNCTGTLALNIKADGLQAPLMELLQAHHITNYFVFDMSVPDLLHYDRHGFIYYSRRSEYETAVSKYAECNGIWLDAFESLWYDNTLIRKFIDDDKKVALVSPELHKRDPETLWNLLKSENLHRLPNIILCTDLPEVATLFFQES
ncbi:hypothetical protein [Flavobacterium sp.]|uniref:hypothetical protein n=1 Tax=Flavobacterium sp. TaxID=239 RepID=UPI00260AEA30|nr:hypothetical protein [Flavobacterium sp.]